MLGSNAWTLWMWQFERLGLSAKHMFLTMFDAWIKEPEWTLCVSGRNGNLPNLIFSMIFGVLGFRGDRLILLPAVEILRIRSINFLCSWKHGTSAPILCGSGACSCVGVEGIEAVAVQQLCGDAGGGCEDRQRQQRAATWGSGIRTLHPFLEILNWRGD